MRQVIVTVALALGWLAVPTDAYSCTCVSLRPGPTPAELTRQVREQLGKARAVFIGEPVASNTLTYRLRVQAVLKGGLGSEAVMAAGAEATRVHDYIPGLSSSVTRGASPDLREEFSPTTLLQPGDQVSVVGPRTIHPHAEL
jgi:hypothetical protein